MFVIIVCDSRPLFVSVCVCGGGGGGGGEGRGVEETSWFMH